MKSICMAALPDLYVIRWLSRFLKHVFPRSRSNARAYSRIYVEVPNYIFDYYALLLKVSKIKKYLHIYDFAFPGKKVIVTTFKAF